MYDELLQFDLEFRYLYDMDMNELINTLEQRRKGLAYKIWKESYLFAVTYYKSKFPATPEEACPELYPVKYSIKMPDFLKEKWLKRGGR